jgi:hypothetical protein
LVVVSNFVAYPVWRGMSFNHAQPAFSSPMTGDIGILPPHPAETTSMLVCHCTKWIPLACRATGHRWFRHVELEHPSPSRWHILTDFGKPEISWLWVSMWEWDPCQWQYNLKVSWSWQLVS